MVPDLLSEQPLRGEVGAGTTQPDSRHASQPVRRTGLADHATFAWPTAVNDRQATINYFTMLLKAVTLGAKLSLDKRLLNI